jgi:N-acetylmuramoyl-L-alanine amidase
VRLATALAVACAPGAVQAGLRLERLGLVDRPAGNAAVLRFSAGVRVEVVPVRAADGRLQRLQLDLPKGVTLAPDVPRVTSGAEPVRRLRVGRRGDGRLRIVLDVVGGGAFATRVADGDRRLTIAVERAAARPRPAPDVRAVPRPATAAAASPPSRVTGTPTVAPPPARPPAPPRTRPLRRFVVVLDAGHGGDDPGAVGFSTEKDVTLDVVRRLARRLRETRDTAVVLTRSSDATVSLTERTAIANGTTADLFVSVHANAARKGRKKGIETYLLDDTDDHATLRLAAIENGTRVADFHAAPTDLRYILSSLVQGGKMADSRRLASTVHGELLAHMRARYPGVDDLGIKQGPFYVLVGSHVPCILVETSFVNHPVEGRRLVHGAYRAALADGLARGIRRFLLAGGTARPL